MKSTKFLGIIAVVFLMLSCDSNSDRVEIDDEKAMVSIYSGGDNSEMLKDSIPNNIDIGKPDFSEQYDPVVPNVEVVKPEPRDPYANVENPPYNEKPSLELVFNGNDIKSFNTTTGEIVLTDLIIEKLMQPNDEGVYQSLALYCNDNLLFKDIKLVLPVHSNRWDGFISLNFSLAENYNVDSQQSLIESYKKGKKYLVNRDTTQKFKTEWDIFIKYLTDAGKIVR